MTVVTYLVVCVYVYHVPFATLAFFSTSNLVTIIERKLLDVSVFHSGDPLGPLSYVPWGDDTNIKGHIDSNKVLILQPQKISVFLS